MAHFLKHLTEETITLKKLLIPAEFVSKCGKGNLTNPVVLEPPVGDPLEVELYEGASGFWLRNGWHELADQYSLRHGHYLLFEYMSYSRFKLVMLGANGLDLEFPAYSFVNVGSNGNQEFPEAEEEEKTVTTGSVEFIGTSLVKDINNNNNNGGGGRQQAQPRSGKSRTTDGGGEGKANWEASQRNRDEPVAKRPFRCENMESNENREFTESDKEEDYVDANYVQFLGSTSVKEINNNNGGGARQRPQLRSAEVAKQKEFISARKRRRANVGENSKVNHETPSTCRGNGSPFERANVETYHTRSMAEQEASKRPSSSRRGRVTTKAVDGLTPEPDFQVVIVKKSSMYSRLDMRGGFVERHITDWKGKMVKLQVEGETWPVRIMTQGDVPALSKGWWEFACHHSLKVGDTLIFVPTNTEDLLSVHILRCC